MLDPLREASKLNQRITLQAAWLNVYISITQTLFMVSSKMFNLCILEMAINFKCCHCSITAHQAIPSLWAGTNNGTVYIFTIKMPGGVKRTSEKATAQLGKCTRITNLIFKPDFQTRSIAFKRF